MNTYLKLRYLPVMLAALMMAPLAHAATSPDLGSSASFSVLSGAGAVNVGNTTIAGDAGVSPAASFTGTSTITFLTAGNPHLADGPAAAGQGVNTAAFTTLDQGCNQTFPSNQDLTLLSPLGPGVYCTAGGFRLTGNLTLTGTNGVWIFKSGSDLVTSPGSSVTGGDPCNIWWRVGSSATIETTTAFRGNILAYAAITMKTSATLIGRAWARIEAVTLGTNIISAPVCSAALPPPSTVPPLINVRKVPSPLALPAGPGPVTYNYTVTNPGTVTMSDITLVDDKCSAVTYVSGDTNGNAYMETSETWRYTCTTTLNSTTINYATARGLGNGMAAVDTAIAEVLVGVPVIPPLIHVLKTPSPLALPFNGGSVAYSYAVSNPGTVALSNVTLTDDKCSAITRVSGDTNGDSKLQSTETWHYTCVMNVPLTMTNTAVATGQANGITAIDTALATVTVAGSPVPPLIHIIKKPEPAILPAGGGLVTYTYTVSNPGTVLLNNVSVTDDKCGPVVLISGDTNGNGMMGPTETWTYTCQQNITAATTNTATAQGSANGYNVSSIAVANVTLLSALIAPAPILPVTGFDPNGSMPWIASFAGVLVAAALVFVLTQWERLF